MTSSSVLPVALAVALLLPVPAAAQYDRDVASPEAIVAALYDVISGPAGQARDWDRMRFLFHPEVGRLVGMNRNASGEIIHRVYTADDYIAQSGPVLESNGFFEQEIGFREDRYGNMLHRFSAYAARRTLADPEPFMRGINSIQLLFDGSRWWIVTVLWDQERAENPLPAELAGPGGQ